MDLYYSGVVETNMMGYADLSQTDTGLHMRQRSRAFIIAEADDPSNIIVFINSGLSFQTSLISSA
jgi:neutral ceramidase